MGAKVIHARTRWIAIIGVTSLSLQTYVSGESREHRTHLNRDHQGEHDVTQNRVSEVSSTRKIGLQGVLSVSPSSIVLPESQNLTV